MGIASRPSHKVIPQHIDPSITVLAFLCQSFPAIPAATWLSRMHDGKVFWEDHTRITPECLCRAQKKIFYFREVPNEIHIPFEETILYQDEHILVACKPHYLPVVPGGPYVESCLLNRLIKRTGIADLNPAHRIDRDTAGLVLFTVRPEERGAYHGLFANGSIKKTYRAVATLERTLLESELNSVWRVNNRIEPGQPRFRHQTVEGEVNAQSIIRCVEQAKGVGLFEMSPLTGKTHQLRIHMSGLGFGLVNDPYYPNLQPEQAKDDFSKPLQLLAWKMSFVDPITAEQRCFTSPRRLLWPYVNS